MRLLKSKPPQGLPQDGDPCLEESLEDWEIFAVILISGLIVIVVLVIILAMT